MVFSDKLNFLMNITQASNKDLAAALFVDRSLISLLRNGKRGLPRNKEHLSRMSVFFARRCTADFQRHALSQMIGLSVLRSYLPVDTLADYLLKWLTDDVDDFEPMIGDNDFISKSPSSTSTAFLPSMAPAAAEETTFYYGNEEKRNAVRQTISAIQLLEQPCEIWFASENNLDWLFEDFNFATEFQAFLIDILEKGFTIIQIMPSVNFLNSYIESLRYWLPLYITGRVKVYYYPRIRDNLYRHSTVIIPEHFVFSSTSIGMSENSITLTSTNLTFVAENKRQFQDYLALCHPAITVHDSYAEFYIGFQNVFSLTGSIIQKVYPLSATTLPAELLKDLVMQTESLPWENTYQRFLDGIPHFEEQLKTVPFIDLSELSSVEDIRLGKIPIASPYKFFPEYPVYTPKTYILHLKNILRLMDEFPNYYFVPCKNEHRHDYNLFVNKAGYALLTRNIPSPLMLEIKRPEMIGAFREHLLRMAEKQGLDGIQRAKTRMEIQALIRELQNYV